MIKISFIKRKKNFTRFSKKCLAAMIILWFIGAAFGFAVVTVQTVRGDMTISLNDVLLYIGAPMTGGVVSYMIKSAIEDNKKVGTPDENFTSEIDQP